MEKVRDKVRVNRRVVFVVAAAFVVAIVVFVAPTTDEPEAGGEGGGVVEQGPGVQDAEHLGLWVADAVTAEVAELGQDRRELAVAGGMHPLQ